MCVRVCVRARACLVLHCKSIFVSEVKCHSMWSCRRASRESEGLATNWVKRLSEQPFRKVFSICCPRCGWFCRWLVVFFRLDIFALLLLLLRAYRRNESDGKRRVVRERIKSFPFIKDRFLLCSGLGNEIIKCTTWHEADTHTHTDWASECS